jgi:hypothetical protein
MKGLVRIVGVIALLAGLLFAGQGAGYIHWPATSTMISDVHWVYYGAGIAAIGLVLILLSRRRRDLRPL